MFPLRPSTIYFVCNAIPEIQFSFHLFDGTLDVKFITGSAENIVIRYLLWPFEVSQIDAYFNGEFLCTSCWHNYMLFYRYSINSFFSREYINSFKFKFQMLNKSFSLAKSIGCCSCFGFIRKNKRQSAKLGINNNLSQELLLDADIEDDDGSFKSEVTNTSSGDDNDVQVRARRSEDILKLREENGMICRQFPVKETHKVVRSEVIVGLVF